MISIDNNKQYTPTHSYASFVIVLKTSTKLLVYCTLKENDENTTYRRESKGHKTRQWISNQIK